MPPTLDEEGNIYLISETTQELLSLTSQGDLRWKTALKYPPSCSRTSDDRAGRHRVLLIQRRNEEKANIEVFSSEGSARLGPGRDRR